MSGDDRATMSDPGTGRASPSPSLLPLGVQASPRNGGTRPAPDLIGLGFLDAHALAAASGLRLAVSVWETSVGPWGRVLDQRPEPKGRTRGRGRIVVTVSGRPREQVPDVRGLPLDDAIDRLVWLGFVPLVGARRTSASVSAGHIITTHPPAGSLLGCGSVVALTVARAQRTALGHSAPASLDVR